MSQIYLFEDWTSATRMRNVIDPCLSVDIGVIRNHEFKGVIEGYQLTVLRSCIGSEDHKIIYRFYIDYGRCGSWCMSTEEAIKFLNQIGFPCKFQRVHIPLKADVEKTLESLKNLGYSHICRRVRPAEIEVLLADPAVDDPHDVKPLSMIIGNYNYHDYWWVDTTPMRIAGILDE